MADLDPWLALRGRSLNAVESAALQEMEAVG